MGFGSVGGSAVVGFEGEVPAGSPGRSVSEAELPEEKLAENGDE